ncbi:MAG: hypothetical protein N5P05_001170 [Chroococcopsis gigantea SAG 12.99]|jgi:hypothetical protein|nr:hypothetical protein [Chroococcopsis gigantea SAG 12.99]
MLEPDIQKNLISFLEDELSISNDSISLALRHQQFPFASLPMLLWQYGLISLSQLDSIFDWLEINT